MACCPRADMGSAQQGTHARPVPSDARAPRSTGPRPGPLLPSPLCAPLSRPCASPSPDPSAPRSSARGPLRVEVHEPGKKVRIVDADGELRAPGVLQNPVSVRSLVDPDASNEAILRNLLNRKGYPDLEAVRDEGRDEGRNEGRDEGRDE